MSLRSMTVHADRSFSCPIYTLQVLASGLKVTIYANDPKKHELARLLAQGKTLNMVLRVPQYKVEVSNAFFFEWKPAGASIDLGIKYERLKYYMG